MKLTPDQVALLHKHITAGLISKSKHQTEDLWIYKYTALAQYSRTWDELTTMCRGLILDADYNIVARPFKKFFNLEEHLEPQAEYAAELPNEPFTVYDKLDGSLGILYWLGDTPHIATCGSFNSKQAEWATAHIQEWSPKRLTQFNPDYTYLFEIIYDQNRIVVDYCGQEGLVLLGAIETQTGRSIQPQYLGVDCLMPVRFDFTDPIKLRSYGNTVRSNTEGFVLWYNSGLKVKIKLDEYLRLHRIIHNTSTLSVWEHLRSGESFEALLDQVPDEFYNWVRLTADTLKSKFDHIYTFATATYNQLDLTKTRKELALEIQDHPYKGLIFSLMDNKDITQSIWKLIKPPYSTPFKEEN